MRSLIGHDEPSALHRIIEANQRVALSKHDARTDRAVQDALDELQLAVDAARDSGVPWGTIGGALAITSGAAYQRYHRLRRCPARRTAEAGVV